MKGFFSKYDARKEDIYMTPAAVAREVVDRFKPKGRILDPCRGRGAFFDLMPGAEWCEIREGRDFFDWTKKVDWIVSNPPYSIFTQFMEHSFKVADDIVYLIPTNKVFNSELRMRQIHKWGGVRTCYVFGGGSKMGFPIGFCIGALHFQKGYRGGMMMEFSKGF